MDTSCVQPVGAPGAAQSGQMILTLAHVLQGVACSIIRGAGAYAPLERLEALPNITSTGLGWALDVRHLSSRARGHSGGRTARAWPALRSAVLATLH